MNVLANFGIFRGFLPVFLGLSTIGGDLNAQPAHSPLNSWVVTHEFGGPGDIPGRFGGVNALAVANDGTIFVMAGRSTGGLIVDVFSSDGQLIRTLNPGGASSMVARGTDELFIISSGGISKYDFHGNFLSNIGSSAPGPGQVLNPQLALSPDGRLFIYDVARQKILVFDDQDNFDFEWGEPGFGPGRLGNGVSFMVDYSNRIWIMKPPSLEVFQENGEFLFTAPVPLQSTGDQIIRFDHFALRNPTGLEFARYVEPPYQPRIGVIDGSGSVVGEIGTEPSIFLNRIAASNDGWILASTQDSRILRMSPAYRSAINRIVFGSPPVPAIVSISPRPGSTILEIDFIVTDVDSASVTQHALAFLGGIYDLTNLVVVETLVDGTEVHRGEGKEPGVPRRFSWDAGSDYAGSGIATATIVVLANDGREFMDLAFVTLPDGMPNVGDPELVISSAPLAERELLEAWFWLIATNDPEIVFSNGEVRGLVGPTAGELLASGSATTLAGRNFLFQRLGVREASGMEIARAQEGTTPGVQQYLPLKRVGNIPIAINEIGVDTGVEGGFWVVKI